MRRAKHLLAQAPANRAASCRHSTCDLARVDDGTIMPIYYCGLVRRAQRAGASQMNPGALGLMPHDLCRLVWLSAKTGKHLRCDRYEALPTAGRTP